MPPRRGARCEPRTPEGHDDPRGAPIENSLYPEWKGAHPVCRSTFSEDTFLPGAGTGPMDANLLWQKI